jgi:peroxiredoxin
MKRKIWIVIIIGIVGFGYAWSSGLLDISKKKPPRMVCIADGLNTPSFTLLNLKGEQVSFSEFKGKVILLDFWATWCPPCRKEIPSLNELYLQYKKDGFVVIGISLDRQGREEVQKFIEKYKVEYVNLMGDDEVVEAFNNIPEIGPIQGIPVTFLINRKGEICRRFVGLTDKQVFEEAIQQVLNSPA